MNYGRMAGLFSKLIADNPKKHAGEIRQAYSDLILYGYKITAIRDEAPSITEVDVNVFLGEKGEEWKDFKFRCIYEKDRKRPLVRDMKGGEWNIVWCR